MGRECFRVPADWQHPQCEDGRGFQPMHMGRDFEAEAKQWLREANEWEAGTHEDLAKGLTTKDEHPFFWMWSGDPPDRRYYRPVWTSEPTHYQMYETTSEGTPISPVMESPEDLARWLADNEACAFGRETASYEAWLSVCKGAWAPSMVWDAQGGLRSGVSATVEKR